MTNVIGYKANLELSIIERDGLSYPQHIFFNAPFKLGNYFRLNNGGIEYILMNASAGIMAGDNYSINISLAENSQLLLSTQSSEKIHKMQSGFSASRKTEINLAKNSSLQYLPFSTIPFAESDFSATTTINISDSAKLVYLDIITAGRVACGELFAFRKYKSLINIYLNESLIFRDNCILEPTQNISALGMFEKYTHLSNLIIMGKSITNNKLDEIKNIFSTCHDGAISKITNGYLVRIFEKSSEQLLVINKNIIEMFD